MAVRTYTEPEYIQVGVIYPTYTDAAKTKNICGYRVFRVRDLKFMCITVDNMRELIRKHKIVTFTWGNYEVNHFHTKYLKKGNDVKYLSEFGGRSVLLGRTSNSYLLTDGSELLKLYDINDLVDANGNGIVIPTMHIDNASYKMIGNKYDKDRRIAYTVDYATRALDDDADSGFEIVTFDSMRKSGHAELDKINGKIALLDLGYEITPNGDVIVTNSDLVVNFIDFNAMKSIGKYMGLAGCKNLKSFVCGTKLKIIYKYAFENCTNLNNVTLRSVRFIMDHAFDSCKSLEKIEFGSSLRSIGSKAFENCGKLKEITLPPTVRFVATNAFDGCKKLRVINVKSPELYKEMIRAQKTIKCLEGVEIVYSNNRTSK